MAKGKTALAKSPSKEAKTPTKTPEQLGLKVAGKGLYRNRQGELTNATGQRVDKPASLLKINRKKKQLQRLLLPQQVQDFLHHFQSKRRSSKLLISRPG